MPSYRVNLSQGQDFEGSLHNIQEYYESIFNNFSLLSWLSDSFEIQILDQSIFTFNRKITTYTCKSSKTEEFLVQIEKNQSEKIIEYGVVSSLNDANDLLSKKNIAFKALRVMFSKHEQCSKNDKNRIKTVILIEIEDKKDYLNSKADGTFKTKNYARRNKLKPHEIQYYYKEPLSIRNKEANECHFSLAFQGGGAKGISYIGVYKALRQLHRNVPINSVIGSSAGGILALAISSEMSPEDISTLCLKMDNIPKDKYYTHSEQISTSDQKEFDSIIDKIKIVLHNYGILEDKMFELIASSLFNIEMSQKILNVLDQINPSIAEIFSLECNEVVEQGFIFKQKKIYPRRFNYYGFLKAAMMKGQAVQNIAAECLATFIKTHLDKRFVKTDKKVEQRSIKIKKLLQKWGYKPQITYNELEEDEKFLQNIKRLTLKQYYSINEVQFTCTSVDLDDKILRFFNHKTTPDLPVCKTVQMTGSFPVAFEAQTWRKQWGKYYIHYQSERKEIDLTGHTFTDGGLLANFPIKYLDNQHMRPMYFSHKKNINSTILYGFGLDPITDSNPTNQEEKKRNLEIAVAQLKDYVLSHLSKFAILKNLITSNDQKKLENVALEEIPILNFVLKLFQTVSVSDYNLNIECFDKTIIKTEIDPRMMEESEKVKKEITKFEKFKGLLEGLLEYSERCSKVKVNELIIKICMVLRQKLQQFVTPSQVVISSVKQQLLNFYYNLQGIRLKIFNQMSIFSNKCISSLEGLDQNEVFKNDETSDEKDVLLAVLSQTIQHYQTPTQQQQREFDQIHQEIRRNQQFKTRKMIETMQNILEKLINLKEAEVERQKLDQIIFIDEDIINDIVLIETKLFAFESQEINNFVESVRELNISSIAIDKQILQDADYTYYKLDTILSKSSSNKIHLVLEAKENSNLYYCGLYSILQEILQKDPIHPKKIHMITCSDFHSIFAFLLAGGTKINKIRREMWKIKELFDFEKGIIESYDKFEWVKTQSQEMKQLQELSLNEQFRMFDELESYVNKTQNPNLLKKVHKVREQFCYAKDTVERELDAVLNYVVTCMKEANQEVDDEKRLRRLSKLLSLKNEKAGKDYHVKNQRISENTKRLIAMFLHHFEQLSIYIILNNYILKQNFEGFDQETKQKVWKGVLIKKLLSSKRLELYIKNKLDKMKLNSNASLAEFYQFCPRKITLNFTLVNKTKQKVEIVNRFTKPNMPVWAAIIASTSMPYIFPEFNCENSWNSSQYTDTRMRYLYNYFFNNNEDIDQTTYISGNFLSTLPLELLTNQKLAKERYTDASKKKKYSKLFATQTILKDTADSHESHKEEDNNFIYITFSFKKKQSKEKQASYQYESQKKRFVNFSNVLNIGIDMLMGRFKNISVGLNSILKRTETLKLIETRIESHDNTIMSLYYDQTTKLPIRLGTLDFYKIERGHKQVLSQSIYQAEFVVREIFENLNIHEDKKSFEYESNKITYLQFFMDENHVHFKFLSKSRWNRKLTTMYDVYYKEEQNFPYIEHLNQDIKLSATRSQLFLKFIFPDEETLLLQEREYLLDFATLKTNHHKLIFKINYSQVTKKYLTGVQLDGQKLKTRVFSKSKAYISQTDIKSQEESSVRNLKVQNHQKSFRIERQSAIIQVKPKQKLQKKLSVGVKCQNGMKETIEKCQNGMKETINKETMKKETIDKETMKNSMIIKSIINLEYTGLYCSSCIQVLSRTSEKQKDPLDATQILNFDEQSCSLCQEKDTIIGYECLNPACNEKQLNRYCFDCLKYYIIQKENGNLICHQKGHHFIYHQAKLTQHIVICNFCVTATKEYFQDAACTINICTKCSLILDSRFKEN